MATLTQTAQVTRRVLKIGAILLVGFVLFRITWSVGSGLWIKINPPPPPPPTVAFNKLPKLKFPEDSAVSERELDYQLETIQGSLPNLGDIGRVFFMPQSAPNLLALDRAKQKARKIGFADQPEKANGTIYRWTSSSTPPTTLEMDINNGNFHLRYQFEDDQELLAQKNLPTDEQAAQEAKSFLQTNNLLTDDLATGSAEFNYLRFAPPSLSPVASLSEADFVRANLFRAGIDGMEILPPNPKKALISFLFSGSRERSKRIIEVDYTYYPIDRNIFATYPLRPISDAWQELQEGNGSIANFGQNEDNKITIRQVYLAYYDSEEAQTFLQPIYVFKGDRDFFGYVPAIDPEWIED